MSESLLARAAAMIAAMLFAGVAAAAPLDDAIAELQREWETSSVGLQVVGWAFMAPDVLPRAARR